MNLSDLNREINAIKEKQRRLMRDFKVLEDRLKVIENITQENNGGVEASDKYALHLMKLNIRNGKVLPK